MAGKDEISTWGSGGLFGNRVLGSLMIMLISPIFMLCFWYACAHHQGSFINVYNHFKANGMDAFWEMVPTPFDPYAWKIIASFSIFEIILMKFVPGKVFKATVTPSGHVPVYNANGFQCYVISIVALFGLWHFGIFNPADVYDNMGKLLSAINVFALCLCAFLTFKGLNFPSTKDSGTNGNLVVDFFWGTELYPQVFGVDIKQFTNCRFGMMYWQLGLLCYAFKQYELLGGHISSSMFVSVFLQTVYIAKFFWWETGYFCSMDIQHDRAGYYLCWGCLCWVPSMYTIHTYFMVEHPVMLSLPTTVFYVFAGLFAIWCNYDCDKQRQDFRASGGKIKIWGRDPEYLLAKYTTKDGEERTSTLLYSGWWGLSRHFHYIPEVSAAFLWSSPALFTHPLPFFYPTFLAILLADRGWRDDARCADKYGKSWVAYCEKVPYKYIPGVV